MPARSRPANPSWIRVIGTTLRLWLRRRVLRVPDSGRVSAARRAGLIAVVLVIAAAIAGGAFALTDGPGRTAAAKAPARHPAARPAASPAVTAQQLAMQANITAASAWITAEISQQAVIECDAYTAGQLTAAGFPPGQQNVLQPGQALPAAAGPAGGPAATLVVTTQTLASQYGSALTGAAPVVLAGFGTGPAAVQVRLVVPGGAAAAAHDAATAQTARRKAGRALARSRRAHLHAAGKAELTAGQVDPRLISVLHKLAVADSMYIMGFGNPPGPPGPAGSPADVQGSPLRLARVDGLVRRDGRRQVSELKAALRLLRSQHAPYLAQLTVSHLASGRVVLTISFPAPSPY